MTLDELFELYGLLYFLRHSGFLKEDEVTSLVGRWAQKIAELIAEQNKNG